MTKARVILLIGRSEKFETLLRAEMDAGDKLRIISWREPVLPAGEEYSHVVLAGYDYASVGCGLREYIKRSYLGMFHFLCAPATQSAMQGAKIVYVNTHCDDRTLLSRYAFAKERLALLLRRKFTMIEWRPQVILGKDGRPDLRAGPLARLIITLLIALHVQKTTSREELALWCRHFLKDGTNEQQRQYQFRHYLMAIPRTGFLDKVARFLQSRLPL